MTFSQQQTDSGHSKHHDETEHGLYSKCNSLIEQRAMLIESNREVVLPPRKVHIWEGDMIWSCASVARHDDMLQVMYPSSVRQRYPRLSDGLYNSRVSYHAKWSERIPGAIKADEIDPDSYQQQALLEDWYHFVADSQCRRITFPSDRLPAISAIASDIVLKINYQYYAGLWIQDSARGLAWRAFGFGIPIPVWRAPTWSWAALDCKEFVLQCCMSIVVSLKLFKGIPMHWIWGRCRHN